MSFREEKNSHVHVLSKVIVTCHFPVHNFVLLMTSCVLNFTVCKCSCVHLHIMLVSLLWEDLLPSHWCTHGIVLVKWLLLAALLGRATLSYSAARQITRWLFCWADMTVPISSYCHGCYIALKIILKEITEEVVKIGIKNPVIVPFHLLRSYTGQCRQCK